MAKPTPGKLLLYWHTLKWLKPVQWRYRIKNALQAQVRRCFPDRVRRNIERHLPDTIACQPHSAPVAWFEKTHNGSHGMFCAEDILRGRFTFLHNSKQFEGPVKWENTECTDLWNFNLHYFEYLDALAASTNNAAEDTIRALLKGWIDNNTCPAQTAWHPYPISLRTINWIKLLINYPQYNDEKTLRSLYSQLLFLERNIEGHLQVNHLLENGRALLFGGIFFDGNDAQRWCDQGLRILKQEIAEEYLPGGGHFERSPMYHCILLEALLNTHALLASTQHETTWLTQPLQKMCAWVEKIKCPDGTFPLFNDAAIGISSTPDEIISNAMRMIGYKPLQKLEAVRDCDQFFVLDADPFFCAVDGAPIGPSYNSGHAHSDNFTYDLFLNGKPLVVDAGTFAYDITPRRIADRSTAQHNTVVINGLEQSEVWSGFRVARRSNPTLSKASRSGDLLVFRGEYTNQVDPSQQIAHERIIVIKPNQWLLIWDTITARDDIEAESFCRLAPGWSAHENAHGYSIQQTGQPPVYFYPIQTNSHSIRESAYAPEFGKSLPTQQISLLTTRHRIVETGYLFSLSDFLPEPHLHIERKADSLYANLCGAEERVDLLKHK